MRGRWHRGGVCGVVVTALLCLLAVAPAEARSSGPSTPHHLSAPSAHRMSPIVGPVAGGTRITMRGTHLDGVRRIWFGGARGRSLRVLRPTLLRVTTPALPAGRVSVVVEAHGRKVRLGHFTYVDSPPPAVTAPVVSGIVPGTGQAGQTVAIQGAGFTGTVQVSFGGVPAPIASAAPSSLMVTVPPHTGGTVPVAVTTAAGVSTASAASQFRYLTPADAPPVVDVIAPVYGPVAGGTAVHIQGTHLAQATQVLFGGVSVPFSVDAAGNLDAVSPSHLAGNAAVQVVNTLGASDPANRAAQFFYESPQPRVRQLEPYRGPPTGGTRVTVTGTGLTGALRVTFDGVAGLDLVDVSDTELQVTAPAHAIASAAVLVTNAQNSSFRDNQSYFSYYRDPNIQAVPIPLDADEDGAVSLHDLACPAPGLCMAVGEYDQDPSRELRRGLAETLRNGGWLGTPLPQPADAGPGDHEQVLDVDCPSTTSCFAVGSYVSRAADPGGEGVEVPLAYRWDGGTWALVPVTLPHRTSSAYLDQLHCAAATSCMAMGEFCGQHGCGTLAASLAGDVWSGTFIRPPNGVDFADARDFDCWAPDGCLAVGTWGVERVDDNDYQGPLLMRWDGQRWTQTLAATPADVSTTRPDDFLQSVSCTVEGCQALGGYRLESLDRQAYVDTITTSGTTAGTTPVESLRRLPTPPDAIPDARIYTESLDCPSFDWCRAVADYQYETGSYRTLDATITPTAITAETVLAPPGSTYPSGVVSALTCPTTAGCVGVGSETYTDFSATTPTTATRLSEPPAPDPYGDYPDGYPFSLTAVAADSPTTAVAISDNNAVGEPHWPVMVTGIPIPAS